MTEVSQNAQGPKFNGGSGMTLGEGMSKTQHTEMTLLQVPEYTQFKAPTSNGKVVKKPVIHPKKVLKRKDTPLQLNVPIHKESSRFSSSGSFAEVLDEEEE